jgi:hypothetical protein
MKTIILIYWLLTTIAGIVWLIKHPSDRRYQDDNEFSLLEVIAYIFPCGLLAWIIVPMMLLHKVKFKR